VTGVDPVDGPAPTDRETLPPDDPDVAVTIARLERRAARERAARLEAEAIAETQLRRSYERSREVELLATIAVVVNQADDLSETLSGAARAVRRHCGFAVSHVLVPDESGAFVTSDIWDADGGHLDFLDVVITATVDQSFAPGVGVPGQVAESHLAIWLPDLSMAGNFPRRRLISSGSAWAFPVVSGIEVVAVIEFLDPSPRPVDERLLTLAPSLGGQIAHASEWDRLRRREVEDRTRLEALVASQAEALAAAQREGADVGAARLSLVAYLSHEVARCAAVLARDEAADEDRAVLDRLDAAARRLVAAADDRDRRVVGERQTVRPVLLVQDALASLATAGAAAVPVSVAPGADRPLELNVGLVGRLLGELLSNVEQQTASGPDRVELDCHDGRLVVRVLTPGALLTWPETGAAIRGSDGLAQAARLAAALGGSVSVRPREDGQAGSVAEVVLAAREGVHGPGAGAGAGEAGRVLVVDDNAINRRLALAMLARAGFAADVVESGEQALGALRDTAYALVLMDIQMPGLDGRETTRAWRRGDGPTSTARDVPIVALTAHVGQDERDACAQAGMDDYLSKPFGIDTLAAMCRRWLEPAQAGSGDAR
jgi:CheY-like chemotaxis protein